MFKAIGNAHVKQSHFMYLYAGKIKSVQACMRESLYCCQPDSLSNYSTVHTFWAIPHFCI